MTRTKIIPLYERLSCDDEYVRCFLLVDFFENSETSLYIAIDGKYTGHILKAIQISRKCLRIVYQNIVLSIAIKLACLIMVAFGMANMWLAIFADVGVMILAILNAIRALRVQKL